VNLYYGGLQAETTTVLKCVYVCYCVRNVECEMSTIPCVLVGYMDFYEYKCKNTTN